MRLPCEFASVVSVTSVVLSRSPSLESSSSALAAVLVPAPAPDTEPNPRGVPARTMNSPPPKEVRGPPIQEGVRGLMLAPVPRP